MSWLTLIVLSPLILLIIFHLYIKSTQHHIEQQSKERQDDE